MAVLSVASNITLADFCNNLCGRSSLVFAMSSLLDSEAHFELRAAEVGLSTNALSALKGHNLATLGKLAHVVSSPGSPPQPEALADWIRDNLRNAT